MDTDSGPKGDGDVAAVFAALRAEVEERGPSGALNYSAPRSRIGARGEAERYWEVTAERPYLFKPGLLGRVRGLALLPVKAPMRRLMRWYVEPLAMDQRSFNRAVLRTIDQLAERLEELDRRIAKIEQPPSSD